MIVDEAAHIQEELFFKVIVPILSVAQTALIALTSPEGSENYFSRLVNLQDETTKEQFFRVIDCLMICKECRKLEAADQAKCTHVKQEAFWLDNRKINRLKQLYKADPATLLREFGGAIADDYEPCFDRHEISVFFNRAPVLAMSPPKQIYVSVDPNGGGASRMAITSGYFDPRGHFVVSSFYSVMYLHFTSFIKFLTMLTTLVMLYGEFMMLVMYTRMYLTVF